MITTTAEEQARTWRELRTYVAAENVEQLIRRVQRLLAAGRRVTLVSRFIHQQGGMTLVAPDVSTGLTGAQVQWGHDEKSTSLSVTFNGGRVLDSFGFSALHGADEDTVEQVTWRYRHGQRHSWPRNITEIRIVGGLESEHPGRDDRIDLWHWNDSGTCRQVSVVFDYDTCQNIGGIHRQVSEHRVTAYPDPLNPDARPFTITVRHRGGDYWVAEWRDRVFDLGGRQHAGIHADDGSRSWPTFCWLSERDALDVAHEAARSLVVDERTPQQHWEHIQQRGSR